MRNKTVFGNFEAKIVRNTNRSRYACAALNNYLFLRNIIGRKQNNDQKIKDLEIAMLSKNKKRKFKKTKHKNAKTKKQKYPKTENNKHTRYKKI